MHKTIFLTLALIALQVPDIYAQGLGGLPSCAQTCVGSGIPSGCGATDIACICKDTAYQATSSCCIFSKCSGSDLQQAISFATQLCAAAQVTLATTAPASCAVTGAPTATASANANDASANASSTGAVTGTSTTGTALAAAKTNAAVDVFARYEALLGLELAVLFAAIL